MNSFAALLTKARNCTLCAADLPHGARPVFQLHPEARILVASQAPGRKVHQSGVPFNDASGDRLREWMGVTREVFYDAGQIAILPMGLCFPGKGKSGDLPPRTECAATWREQLLAQLHHLEVTLAVGQYAQVYHMGKEPSTLTDRVRCWESYWPEIIPLPHPSPRNNIWLTRNPWFEKELLPSLKQRVAEVLGK